MSRYSSLVMEHFEDPRNCGTLAAPDAVGQSGHSGRAPRMTIQLQVKGDVVRQAMFQAFGCGFSIACGSMLTELAVNCTVSACREITAEQLDAALEGLPPDKHHCPLLAVAALRDALDQVGKSAAASESEESA